MDNFNSQQLSDEVFCIKYELDLLAGQVAGTGLERWIEGFTPISVHQEHMQRYEFACRFSQNKRIIDVACGTGRGARILAEDGNARNITAYDIEEKAIRYARIRNHHQKVAFNIRDGLDLDHQCEFDLAVCFETIEHVYAPEQCLARLACALKEGGLLLISTPMAVSEHCQNPANPYHLQEWGVDAFKRLLGEKFAVRRLHIQYRPISKLPLWFRVLRRFGLNRGVPSVPGPSMPLWAEFSGDVSMPKLPMFSCAYQVVECVRK